MIDTENSNKSAVPEQLQPYAFKPGVSGNPGGRPKNPLKEFSMKEFESWSEQDKKSFLKKIAPIDRWRMTEGNPHQTTDTRVEGELNLKGVNISIRE